MATKLQIAIEALDNASDELKKVSKEIEGVDKAAEKADESSGGLSDAFGVLSGVAGSLGLALGAMELVKTTWEMTELGAAINRTTSSLNAMTDGDADRYILSIREALNNTVTEFEAAQIAAQLYGLEIASTATEVAEFTRIAAILGGTFQGLGAAEAAQELATLISNESLLRLDTFGISSSRVRQRMEELQASGEALGKSDAFQKAFWEVATVKADELSGVLTDQKSSVEQLQAAWRDLREEVAVTTADAVVPVINKSNELRQATIDEMKAVARAAETWEDYQNGLRETGLVWKLTADQREDVWTGIQFEREELAKQLEMLAATSDSYNDYFLAAKKAGLANNDLAVSIHDVWEAFQESPSEEVTLELIRLANAEWDTALAMRGAGEAAQELAADNEELEETESGLERAIREREEAMKAATEAATALLSEQQSLAAVAQTTTEALSNLGIQGFQSSGEAGKAFMEVLKSTGNELLLAGDAYDQLRLKSGLVTEAQLELEHGFKLIGEAAASIGVDQAFILFEEFSSGAIGSVEELMARIDELAGKSGEVNAYMEAAIKAGDMPAAVEEAMAPLEESLDNLAIKYESVGEAAEPITRQLREQADHALSIGDRSKSAFEIIIAQGPLAFEAINPLTGSMENQLGAWEGIDEIVKGDMWNAMNAGADGVAKEGAGLAGAALMIHDMWKAWMDLHKFSTLNLVVNIEQNGSIPSPPQGQAMGGPVDANTPYIVGEQGPELFIPANSGTIIPNHQLGGYSGGGGGMGGTAVYLTFNNYGLMMADEDELANAILPVFEKAQEISDRR